MISLRSLYLSFGTLHDPIWLTAFLGYSLLALSAFDNFGSRLSSAATCRSAESCSTDHLESSHQGGEYYYLIHGEGQLALECSYD